MTIQPERPEVLDVTIRIDLTGPAGDAALVAARLATALDGLASVDVVPAAPRLKLVPCASSGPARTAPGPDHDRPRGRLPLRRLGAGRADLKHPCPLRTLQPTIRQNASRSRRDSGTLGTSAGRGTGTATPGSNGGTGGTSTHPKPVNARVSAWIIRFIVHPFRRQVILGPAGPLSQGVHILKAGARRPGHRIAVEP